MLTRVLCDALEADYIDKLNTSPAQWVCPLAPDIEVPGSRYRVTPKGEKTTITAFPLGTLLAAQGLPPEINEIIATAMQNGIDWCHSEQFWATLSARQDGAQVADDGSGNQPAPHEKQSGAAACTIPAREPEFHNADITPDPLCDAVVSCLNECIATHQFNVCNGDGWYKDGVLWVSAKKFALRLQQIKWIQQQPKLIRRETLYRVLLRQSLTVPYDEGSPVHKIYAIDGQQRQFVTALRLSDGVLTLLDDLPVFTGDIVMATDHGASSSVIAGARTSQHSTKQ